MKRNQTSWQLAAVALLAGLVPMTPASAESAGAPPAKARPKKIFAHYMGCWPTASGPMVFDFQNIKNLRHDQPGETEKMGGHVRNWSVPSPDAKLSLYDSIDLEIRRALHIGIDGFTVDAWAGGQSAKDSLDMMFKVAEEKNYPFEITITPDPNALSGSSPVEAIKYLLDKHGKSPKLARRDGKPLIFGYQSVFVAITNAEEAYKDNPQLVGTWIWDKAEWRLTPKGWDYMGKAMKAVEKKVGQPLYMQFAMEAMDYGVGSMTDDMKVEAAGILGKYVGGVGAWSWLGMKQDAVAAAARKSGAEWMYPIGFGQKENIPWESWGPPGLEWFRGGWEGVIGNDSTLLQYVTWNDYGENSALAPAFNTRYALFDLTNYYISRWKNGKEPKYAHDKVYLAYHKYPHGAKIFPFKEKFRRGEAPALEVVTILTKPATIRLPGRGPGGKPVEYAAPAGFFSKQFPNTPGEVVAEVVREGKVSTRIQSPEPITDKPFREDNGFVAWSSEEERHWKSDFGPNKPMWIYSEYGDEDKDGLPNWFEMYWFGTWMDFSTQTQANPNEDPDRDGKTNLQEWQEQTDPTLSPEETKLAGSLPLAYLKHRARGQLVQPGSRQIPFPNGDFEEAGQTPAEAANWQMKNGAVRSSEKVSKGKWSAKMPPPGPQGMAHILQAVAGNSGYAWNSDPLHPNSVRAGNVVGYSVDAAVDVEGATTHGYMRLANDAYAGGSDMWGIPIATVNSAKFLPLSMAQRISEAIQDGGGMGGTWGNQVPGDGKATLYLDNFSPLTVLRPQLGLSSTEALNLGQVAANAEVRSNKMSITNSQKGTLTRQLNPAEPKTRVATVLYGVASFKADDKKFEQRISTPTDHVGAILTGSQAELFEFVTANPGNTPRELKLVGVDGKPGLVGGPEPESEEVVVRFKGAPQPGTYATTLRIVTQAANMGTHSLLKAGEPPYNLFYVDIPVSVTVQ